MLLGKQPNDSIEESFDQNINESEVKTTISEEYNFKIREPQSVEKYIDNPFKTSSQDNVQQHGCFDDSEPIASTEFSSHKNFDSFDNTTDDGVLAEEKILKENINSKNSFSIKSGDTDTNKISGTFQ